MRLAERLGATTVRLNARDLTAEVLGYAKRNNATQMSQDDNYRLIRSVRMTRRLGNYSNRQMKVHDLHQYCRSPSTSARAANAGSDPVDRKG